MTADTMRLYGQRLLDAGHRPSQVAEAVGVTARTAQRWRYDEPLAYHRSPFDDGWRARAACAGMSPDVFYPERGESTEPARRICRGCSVQQSCLDYALEAREVHGVFGGRSERERRNMRSRRRGLR